MRSRPRPHATTRSPARGDVWVADVARAWVALNATSDDQRQFIAEMLGFRYEPRAGITEAPIVVQPQRPVSGVRGEPVGPREPETLRDEISPGVAVAASLPLRVRAVDTGRTRGSAPSWIGAPALPSESEGDAAFRPEPVSLLVPGWTRAIAAAAVATRFADGPIDVEGVIDRVCKLRPLVPLPRRSVWTARHAVQLLVDRGQGMMPFAREATRLADRIRAVAGRDRTTMFLFRDCPTRRRKTSPKGGDPVYEPPAAGVPVIVITDLGLTRGAAIRGGASEEEWLAFAATIRRAHCPLVAFVPCAFARVPDPLRRVFHTIPWDRATTVGLVRQITRGIRL